MAKKTLKQFIVEAKKAHGDKYDYTESEYVNTDIKLIIICKIHGAFYQVPANHIKGHGCKQCAVDRGTKAQTKSLNQFIVEARQVHGDKYDYSYTKYVNVNTKITILCKKHGEFCQLAMNHLKGSGCSKCSGDKRAKVRKKSIDQFIIDAKRIHGEIYNYSKVNYINANTKIKIICKQHGVFFQLPYNHLTSQQGCPVCGGTVKLTNEEFIKKSKEVHHDMYDYSLVNYVNNNTKVKLICKYHGVFEQLPSSHLNGRGCSTCGTIKGTIAQTKDVNQFIEDAKQVHGEKYDYSMVNYVNTNTKVNIICRDHGCFDQLPANHVKGHGCNSCGIDNATKLIVKTKEQFIMDATKVHGNEFDYSMVTYINANVKVKIKHIKCGNIFYQAPSKHIDVRCGCPYCATHGYQLTKPGTLYYIRFEIGNVVNFKIGITTRSIQQRISTFRLTKDVKTTVIYHQTFTDGTIPPVIEQHIKQKYKKYINTNASRFMRNGYSETYTVDILADMFDNQQLQPLLFEQLFNTITTI